MDREISVSYTPELAKIAAWHFWRRYIGWGGIVSISATLVGLIYLIVFNNGEPLWLAILLVAVLCFAAGMFIVGYVNVLSRAMNQLKKMKSATGQFRFTE